MYASAQNESSTRTSSGCETAARNRWFFVPRRSRARFNRQVRFLPIDPLMPDEVIRLGADPELLLRPGAAPVIAEKVRHYADVDFQGMFDPG